MIILGMTHQVPKQFWPVDPVFTVSPEEITLKPRTATAFTFKGYTKTAGMSMTKEQS
jgi:hypothetical protein